MPFTPEHEHTEALREIVHTCTQRRRIWEARWNQIIDTPDLTLKDIRRMKIAKAQLVKNIMKCLKAEAELIQREV
jgi:hypothetical protein